VSSIFPPKERPEQLEASKPGEAVAWAAGDMDDIGELCLGTGVVQPIVRPPLGENVKVHIPYWAKKSVPGITIQSTTAFIDARMEKLSKELAELAAERDDANRMTEEACDLVISSEAEASSSKAPAQKNQKWRTSHGQKYTGIYADPDEG
jgi:hypothetical protein